MEPEDGGYATTDEELDSDDDGGVELDLKMWLNQLDSPATSTPLAKISSSKGKASTAVTAAAAASRTSKTEQHQGIDFESILGQLSSLDEQFNDLEENDSSFSKPVPLEPSPKVKAKDPDPNSRAGVSREIADDFGDINSQLMDAILELNQLVDGDTGSKSEAVPQSVDLRKPNVQPVVKASQRCSNEQPVVKASQRCTNEQPVVRASQRCTNEQPVVRASQRCTNEQPVVKASQRCTNEQPVVKASQRCANEQPVVKASQRCTNEQPVVSQRCVAPISVTNTQRMLHEPLPNDAKKPFSENTKTQKPPGAVRTSVKQDAGSREETVSLKSTDSSSSSIASSRLSGRSNALENLPQVCLKVFSPDGNSKSVLVDECTTVGHLCEILVQKSLSDRNRTWGIAEQIPDLFMQRLLEDHQLILEEIREWEKATNNRLVFLETPKKYDMFNKSQILDESRWEPTGLEGWLHLKTDGKKAWKKWNCVLRDGGIFYSSARSKGKPAQSCVGNLGEVEVFTSVAWKKKFKAPTEFGFALKLPATQKKSSGEIKYLCADDQVTMWKWVTAIRVAKYGLQLYTNFRQSVCLSENSSLPAGVNELPADADRRQTSTNRGSAGTAQRGSIITEDLAMQREFDNCSISSPQRRGSVDSTRSGSVSEIIPSGSKMKAQIPITAQTARLLSMQPCSMVQTLPRSTSRRESQKSPSVNATERVHAKPTLAAYQTGLEIDPSGFRPESPDLPPPPPEFLTASPVEWPLLPPTPGKGPSGRKPGPPAPPRRDESTKLSFKAKHKTQTQNFILNLQRAIGQKFEHGAAGMTQLEMPLPPPPAYSDEPSYLDLGDLPPPPAELLEELKVMRRKSKQPPPTPTKHGITRASKMH